MPATRAAARSLANAGLIEVTQKGNVVDIARVKGPIRLRLLTDSSASEDAFGA